MKKHVSFLLILVLLQLTSARQRRKQSETVAEEKASDRDFNDFFHELAKSNRYQCPDFKSVNCAREWLVMYDKIVTETSGRAALTDWKYGTNMTSYNAKLVEDETLKSAQIVDALRSQAKQFRWRQFRHEPDLKRTFRIIIANTNLRDKKKQRKLLNISSKLEEIYASAQACLTADQCLRKGENEPNKLMSSSNDYDQLLKVWQSWHDNFAISTKSLYTSMVHLLNQGAQENDYFDFGHAEWFDDVREKDFPSTVKKLFQEIKPFFEQLHAFVRYRLLIKYPGKFSPDGVIPAHLLGNLWAQSFHNLGSITKPFPTIKSNSVTERMLEQKYTVNKIVRTAEQFFTSLGMYPMTKKFWKKSIFELNPNVTMECHPSAQDLYRKDDFRISMCSDISLTTIEDVHHEMGHVEYFMAYENLPIYYRNSANSGFHEAVGDTIGLSFATSSHLYKVGLSDKIENCVEEDMNYLMNKALKKIAFLPFAVSLDSWRWSVANGQTTSETYNKDWWILRESLQGIGPPVERSERTADALGKLHVINNVPYIRYFMSYILQFQFYKAMCKEADHQDALFKCDFYNSKAAGKKLLQMLRLGLSKPWPDALEMLTGSRELDTGPLLEYFEPLMKWLAAENKRNNVPIGWKIPTNPLASVTL